MSNTHTVWAANASPEWLTNNDSPDMVMCQADHYNANLLALRLQLLVPGVEVAIKDANGNFVPIVPEGDAYRELVENPRRASVGLPPRETKRA